jgi:hypothetical protein
MENKMPRPTTKADLLDLANRNIEKLFSFIESLPKEYQEKEYPLNERDKTIRDVLCHLYEWHCMMEHWYDDGIKGKDPVIPAEGYTWKTLPAMNREIWKKYQDTSFLESKKLLRKSHKKMMSLIESISNEDLFSSNVYKWTKTTTLGAYFVSATSSHYDWALKTVKPIKKMIV